LFFLIVITGVYLTALDDWVLGIATFGLYNLWKATRQARVTVQKTGTAIEGITDDIGTSAAVVGTSIFQVAGDLMIFVRELEELMTVRGTVPRNEEELWDAEVERLRTLREKEKELLDELTKRGVDRETAGTWSDIFSGNVPVEAAESNEKIQLMSKLSIVRSAIDEMLYAEPGVVPTCLYDVEEALTRFNMLEQTGIEELLFTTRNTVEESEAFLKEVEKLIVVRKWKPVDAADLSAEEREELARLQSSLKLYERLIEINSKALIRLQEELLLAYPEEWNCFLDAAPLEPSGATGETGDEPKGGERGGEMERSCDRPGTDPPYMRRIAGTGIITRNPEKFMPKGVRIARSLHRTEISAFLGNHAAFLGVNQYYERERLKVEKKIALLTRVPVEEPGVIPGTLEEMRQSIARFRIEGQPRLEILLDNLNEMLIESRRATARTDRILEKVEALSDFACLNAFRLKIGAAVFLGLVLTILVVILILLVKLVLPP
jgi:hypothetical protein